MPFERSPKINRKLMPQPAAARTVRYRYDWKDLEIGEGFAFAPSVKIMSARVMCANNGANLDRIFRCYRGVDEKLYAIRMASLYDELPTAAPEHEAPRINTATAPAVKELLGDFGSIGKRPLPDNALALDHEEVSTLKGRPPETPKTAAQIAADKIRAEQAANIAEDDVI